MTSCGFPSNRALVVVALALMACAGAGCASVPTAGTGSPPSAAPRGNGQAEPAADSHGARSQGTPAPAPGGAEPAAAPDEAGTEPADDRTTTAAAAPVPDRPATGAGLILAAPAGAPAAAAVPTPDRNEEDRARNTAGGATASPAGTLAHAPPLQDPERGAAQLVFRLSASPGVPRVGDQVTVEVQASSTARVVDAPLHLVYDAARLRYLGGEEGDFLRRDGSGTVFLINGLSQSGVVTIGLGRLDRSHGLSGAGTHCRVRFAVIAPGPSRVAVGQAMAWADDGSRLAVGTDAIDLSVPVP